MTDRVARGQMITKIMMEGNSTGRDIVDPHFSRAPPLDRRDSFFICEKLIFGKKVGVATYFILFFKRENKTRNKTLKMTP